MKPLLPSSNASQTSDIDVEQHAEPTLDSLGNWLFNDEFDNYSDGDSLMPRKPKSGPDTASLSLHLLSICSGSTCSITGKDDNCLLEMWNHESSS